MPGKAKQRVRTVRLEVPAGALTGSGDDDESALDGAPLFDRATAKDAAWCAVTRTDPEEGYVGRIAPTATEHEILQKFGGGVFALSLRNQHGKPISGGFRNLEIAGDPIFKSKQAESRWKRANGISEPEPARAAPAGGGSPSIVELMMLMDKQQERAAAAAALASAAREKETAATHARQLELAKLDGERKERELAEERRRLAENLVAERERDRQHFAAMLQISNAKAAGATAMDPIGTLMAGVKLAAELGGRGGDGDDDPMSAFAKNLPAVATELRRMVRPDKPGAPAPAPVPTAARPGGQPAGNPRNAITFADELGAKAIEAVKLIQSCNLDPEKILLLSFQQMIGRMHELIEQQKRQQAQQPAPAQQPPNGAAALKDPVPVPPPTEPPPSPPPAAPAAGSP